MDNGQKGNLWINNAFCIEKLDENITMTPYNSIEEVEDKLFPNDVYKYPVVFRRRVTQDEANAINDWINKRRAHCE